MKNRYIVYRCVDGCGSVVVKPIESEEVVCSHQICTKCGYAMVVRFLSENKDFQLV